jgi:hypothetical protein
MEPCTHGMDQTWCYLCRVDAFGVDPQVLWGIALDEDLAEEVREDGPMIPALAGYLRFLCEDLGLRFDSTFTQGEAARVIPSLLSDPASESQERTLAWLCERAGAPVESAPVYGDARTKIRRLVALRGLRSA